MRYVIIGGGVAGTTAAGELRKLDAEAEIVLISEEFHPLYSRVLLPHFLKGKIPRERVFLKKESWYSQQNIEWMTGVRVDQIDTKNKQVVLSDQRELAYDKLLITTGGEVRHAQEDLRGVSYFRTLDDADHLQQLVMERADHRAVVFGGGFIACEYVNFFAHHNIPTSVVFRGAHLFASCLDEQSGALIEAHLRAHEVTVIPHQTIEALLGDQELSGVRITSQTLPATILGVGIGIKTDVALLNGTGIETGCGIKTNAYLETTVNDVYAAGDVAEFFDTTVFRERQVGNWMSAMSQGRHAAQVMAGERTEFSLVSSYATNILGLEIIFVGDTSREHADQIRVIGDSASGGVTQVFVRGGVVVGATMVGRNKDRQPLTQAIKNKQSDASLDLA